MKKRRFIIGLGTFAFLFLPGRASSTPPKGLDLGHGAPVVSGTVSMGKTSWGDLTTLPRMAKLRVELMDVSGEGSWGGILGEETVWLSTGKLPVDFRIPYDPSRIDPTHAYMIRARIMEGEKVLFLNTIPYYVLTKGAPSKIDIVVIPAQANVR